MKKSLLISLFVLSMISSHAQNFYLKGCIKSEGIPIRNAYLFTSDNGNFGITDDSGNFKFEIANNGRADSILVSHIGFETKKVLIPKEDNSDTVILNIELISISYTLAELVISDKQFPSADMIINEVKAQLENNYVHVIDTTLSIAILESYINTRSNTPLLSYDGKAFINFSKRGIKGCKYDISDFSIDPNFFNYHIEAHPARFLSHIPLSNHAIIKKTNLFSFQLDDVIVYNNQDVYKVSFYIDRKCGGQKGYLLINVENHAVYKIVYEYNSCKKMIAGKYKSTGLLYTDLVSSNVSISYRKNTSGKYEFESGLINGLYKMHSKKKVFLNYSLNCEFSLYKEESSSVAKEMEMNPIKELFF